MLFLLLLTSVSASFPPSVTSPSYEALLSDVFNNSPSELDLMIVQYKEEDFSDIMSKITTSKPYMMSSITWIKNNYDIDVRWTVERDSRRPFYYLLIVSSEGDIPELLTALQTIRTFDYQAPIVILSLLKENHFLRTSIVSSNLFQTHLLDFSESLAVAQLRSFCAYCQDGEHSFMLVNRWEADQGFRKHLQFPRSFRGSFNGYMLRFGHIPYTPHRYSRTSEDGQVSWDGFEYNFFMTILKAMNGTVKFITPADRHWGLFKNGTWTGQIRQLVDKEADIAGMPILVDYMRNRYTEPTSLLQMYNIKFVSAKPQLASQWSSFVRPFTPMVWATLFLFTFLSGVVFYTIMRIHAEETRTLSLTYCMFDVIRILCWEVVNDKRPSTPRIIHIGVFMLASSVLIYSYTGILLSHITAPVYKEQPINNHHDLLARSGMLWLVPAGQQLGKTFDSDPVMKSKRRHFPSNEALEMITESPDTYAFFNGIEHIKAVVYSDFLDPYGQHIFHFAKESSAQAFIVWLLQKETCFLEEINNKILNFQAGGLYGKIQEDAYETLRTYGRKKAKQNKVKALGTGPEVQFTVAHLAGGAVILGIGCLLATVSFVLELLTNKILRK